MRIQSLSAIVTVALVCVFCLSWFLVVPGLRAETPTYSPNGDIMYPSEINTNEEKLAAVNSLLGQMRYFHNQVGDQYEISPSLQSRWNTFAELYKRKQLVLLEEKHRLQAAILWSTYTPEEWVAFTDEERSAAKLVMYGNEVTQEQTPTTATSESLGDLLTINLITLESLPLTDPLEDFTTYTEYDTGAESYFTITSNNIDFLIENDEDAYVYDDKGVDHFTGDFEHLFQINYTSNDAWGGGHTWVLSNYGTGINGTVKYYSLTFGRDGGGLKIYLYERYYSGGWTGQDDTMFISLPNTYWVTLDRTGSTLRSIMYSDSTRSTEVDTLSFTVSDSADNWQYIYAAASDNWGSDRNVVGYIRDLDLQEVSPRLVIPEDKVIIVNGKVIRTE